MRPEPGAELDGEVALVTGASRGIGQAILVELARRGAAVIGTATSAEGAGRIEAALESRDLTGKAAVLQLPDPASIAALLEGLGRDGQPSILVNNAGVTRDNLLARMKDEEWQATLDTNLTGVFRLTKACLRAMMRARHGRIVNIASVVGATGNPGQTNYAATKAGIIGFTKSLAREVGSRGITVNAVAPGFIDTDMTRALEASQREQLLATIPLARLGAAEEVAAAVAFIASGGASYITGETLHVNGGMHMA